MSRASFNKLDQLVVTTPRETKTFPDIMARKGAWNTLRFSPSTNMLGVCDPGFIKEPGVLRVIDCTTWLMRTYPVPSVTDVLFFDEMTVMCCSYDGQIRLDLLTGEATVFDTMRVNRIIGHAKTWVTFFEHAVYRWPDRYQIHVILQKIRTVTMDAKGDILLDMSDNYKLKLLGPTWERMKTI